MDPNAAAVLASLKKLKAYNISPVIENNMPGFGNNPGCSVVSDARTYEKHFYYCQTLIIGEHIGAHIDAPAHTVPGAATIEKFAPGYFFAPYKLFDTRPLDLKEGDVVTPLMCDELAEKGGISLEPDDVALFCFGWDKYYLPDAKDGPERSFYGLNAPGLSDECCQYLLDKKIKAVGSDSILGTIPRKGDHIVSLNSHDVYFLPHGVPIIEGLINLTKVPAEGIFAAMPLGIKNGSGSPVSAVIFA
ncbi:MAG: cyclase family protein [Oscillospiraceae bacterium]|nr:cyclase family protein [Oscillospiraceae bacterium]